MSQQRSERLLMADRGHFLKSGVSFLLLIALFFTSSHNCFAKVLPAQGSLLVAAGEMVDPRFRQSVILLLQHGKEGTVGLIINKALPVTINQAVPGLPEDIVDDQPLFFGGPVNPGTAWVLFAGEGRPDDTIAVLPGLFVANATRFFSGAEMQIRPDRLKILIGYSGWAPGQLEREVERGDWKVTPARSAEVFDADPGSLWQYLSGKGAVLI